MDEQVKREESAEDMLSRALSMARDAYARHVTDLVEDIVDAIKRGDIEDRDGLYTYVHETVDGDGWVIYTAKAQLVAMVSSNSEAGMEEGLIDTRSFKDGIPWSQIAYCALERDVMDELSTVDGIDINDDNLGREEEEEESDES